MGISLEIIYRTNLLGVLKLFSSSIAFFIFAFCFKRQSHLPAFKYLKLYALTMGLWDLLEGLFYLVPDHKHLPLIAQLFYMVIPFASSTFFYFCFAYAFPYKEKLIKNSMSSW